MKDVDGARAAAAATAFAVASLPVAAAAFKRRADDEVIDAVVIKIAGSGNADAETRSIAFAENYR